jgi:hypothetical protein
VRRDYPELSDDDFVAEHLAGWMAAASARPGASTAPAAGA